MSMDENPKDWPDNEQPETLEPGQIRANMIKADKIEARVATAEQAEALSRLVDWTKAKAIWTTVAAAAVLGLGSLYSALDNDVVTTQEWIAAIIATLGGSTVLGVTTYSVPNRAKPKKEQ